MNRKTMRKKLRSMIEDKYISVRNFSHMFGFDQSDLNKFLVGRKDINTAKLFKILEALEAKIEVKE